MSKILITGGTGKLGCSLTRLLRDLNVPYTVASRSEKLDDNIAIMDLLSKKGITEGLRGKEIIFHLATDMKRDTELTRNLIDAIGSDANVHLIYSSIVGIENVPLDYYKQKLASEAIIKKSGIPYTILRATQFHEFIDEILSTLLKYPFGLLPKKVLSQPIETAVVAVELYKLSFEKAVGNTYEIGGQQVHTLEQMAEDWQKQTGKKRWLVNLPLWGRLGKGLRNGSLTTPNKRTESASWKEWLTNYQYLSV